MVKQKKVKQLRFKYSGESLHIISNDNKYILHLIIKGGVYVVIRGLDKLKNQLRDGVLGLQKVTNTIAEPIIKLVDLLSKDLGYIYDETELNEVLVEWSNKLLVSYA